MKATDREKKILSDSIIDDRLKIVELKAEVERLKEELAEEKRPTTSTPNCEPKEERGVVAYDEVLLPKRAIRQPTPHLHTGGDCGACVLGGLFGLTVPQVYETFSKGEPESFGWNAMYDALWKSTSLELADRLISDIPYWHTSDSVAYFGNMATCQALAWFAHARMALDAGYYGVAGVVSDKDGAYGKRGPDHVVLIAGVRQLPPPGGTGGVPTEVFVSNSSLLSAAEEWIDVHVFLRDWGGFNSFWVRPVKKKAAA